MNTVGSIDWVRLDCRMGTIGYFRVGEYPLVGPADGWGTLLIGKRFNAISLSETIPMISGRTVSVYS